MGWGEKRKLCDRVVPCLRAKSSGCKSDFQVHLPIVGARSGLQAPTCHDLLLIAKLRSWRSWKAQEEIGATRMIILPLHLTTLGAGMTELH